MARYNPDIGDNNKTISCTIKQEEYGRFEKTSNITYLERKFVSGHILQRLIYSNLKLWKKPRLPKDMKCMPKKFPLHHSLDLASSSCWYSA